MTSSSQRPAVIESPRTGIGEFAVPVSLLTWKKSRADCLPTTAR
ncbi:hypothetical protein ACFFX0_25520 [Citricoccus parietis]|uniref:Uncharacterized protein n=1 Tax=Citricoccus parietis TaxID=592307 RepID=A0ABV5G610_9MICC